MATGVCWCFFGFLLPGRWDWIIADGEHITCMCFWCWYGHSDVYFGKDSAIKERVTCPLR
jgi:hypothetical protein